MQTNKKQKKQTTKFVFFALLRCRLSYLKIVQTEDKKKKQTTKFVFFALLRCRLSYLKMVQTEGSTRKMVVYCNPCCGFAFQLSLTAGISCFPQ